MSAQLNSIVKEHQVQAVSGQWIPMKAETFCLHGDHPNVVRNLKELLSLYPVLP
jgi:lactam utilization protein B